MLGNASEAYRRAFDPATSSIYCGQRAHDLLKKPEIAAMIEAKRKESMDRATMTVDLMLERLRLIIDCDPAEITALKRGACRHCYGDDHQYQWREPDYWAEVRKVEMAIVAAGKKGIAPPLPDFAGGFGYNATKRPHPGCPKCDGQGIERVHAPDTDDLSEGARASYLGTKQTRNGLEIMTISKEKAIELYGKFAGWSDVNVRLGAEAGLLSEAVRLATSDPNEAAREYRRMLNASG